MNQLISPQKPKSGGVESGKMGKAAKRAASGKPRGVDRRLPFPLYHQIYTQLRDRIFDGTYASGDLVPSEHQLVRQFRVSRITAKRALDELAARGLIVRQRGRGHGSRVLPKIQSAPLLASVEGLLENNLIMGFETEVDLLEFDYVPASEVASDRLKVGQGEIVQMAVRVRRIDGQPFSYLTTYLPEKIGRSFQRQELMAFPLLALLERSGVSVSRADQTISATAADRKSARELNVEPGAPLLSIERVVFGEHDAPVEYIVALYVPEIYQYRMSLERMRKAGGNWWSTSD